MLYINGEKVTVKQIETFSGDDVVYAKLKKSIKKLRNDYWGLGIPVRFKLRKNYIFKDPKTGLKEYKGGIWIPFTESVNTPNGTALVTYCESATTDSVGKVVYKPAGYMFKKSKVFQPNDIEMAIFFDGISAVVNLGNKIELEDKIFDAKKVTEDRKRSAALDFYLYSEDSPMYDNKEKIHFVANFWGITVGKKTNDMLLHEIRDAVLRGKEGMGIEEFKDMMKEYKPFMTIRKDIQLGLDKGILLFEPFKWYFADNKGNKSMICSVDPQQSGEKVKVLTNYFESKPETYDLLKKALAGSEKYIERKPTTNLSQKEVVKHTEEEAKAILKAYAPELNQPNVDMVKLDEMIVLARNTLDYTGRRKGITNEEKVTRMKALIATLE